eukprot:Skav229734  [mRNA]  locus=scaffold1287:104610:109895:+ [translate_table: standard]
MRVVQVGHAATDVEQFFEQVTWDAKLDRLCELLEEVTDENGDPRKTIVFANTKDGATAEATDVAARGLDVPGIDHIVNYDLPNDGWGSQGTVLGDACPTQQKWG